MARKLTFSVGDYVRIDQSRRGPTGMARVLAITSGPSPEATIQFEGRQPETWYAEHMYQDMECHRRSSEARRARADAIGRKAAGIGVPKPKPGRR